MITLPSHRYLTPLLLVILILLTIHLLSIANYSLITSPILASHTSTSHHTTPHPPPPEYPNTHPTDADERCEANHGLPYLQHIAHNHISYCDAKSSKSGFECFKTIYEDLLCVAQGVQYRSHPDPSSGDITGFSPSAEEHRPFSMHCAMRNLTQERLDEPSESNIAALKGFPTREDMKEYMYDTGIPFQLKSWGDGDGQNCNAQQNDGTYTVLVKREQTGNIWHRLLEMWQVKLSLDAITMSSFLGPGFERSKVQVVFQDDTPGPWDELLWPMLTGTKPQYLSELEDGCLGTVILPLPGSTSPFWWGVWEVLPCRESFLFDPFIKEALKYMELDTPPRLTQDTIVTIVNRTGTSNTRQLWSIDSHAEALRQSFPGVTVQVLDFAAIELRKQIEVIRDTDVLIGAMGAGLTHLFFLNEESTVAEILAPGAQYAGFRNLAKIRKMPYFVTHGVEEEKFIGTEEYKKVMGGGKVKEISEKADVVEEVAPAVTETVREEGKLAHVVEDVHEVSETAAVAIPEPAETPTEQSIEDEAAQVEHVADAEVQETTESAEERGINELSTHADDEQAYQRRRAKRGTIGIAKRHWQDDPYLYLSEKQFIALAAAAINAQGNRGTRMKDVYPH